MLRTLATQHFIDQNVEAAASLLTAALQFSPSEQKAKTAHLLAGCNLKLGNSQKAMQYLNIASNEKGEDGENSTALGALLRMTAAVDTGENLKAQKGKKKTSKSPLFIASIFMYEIQISS